MLNKTLMAVAALSFVAFGATAADAKGSHGHGGGYGTHGGKHHGGRHHGHRPYWKHQYYRYPPLWLNYAWSPRCRYVPRKARIKVWDRHGRPYHKWVWRDVKVCN